MSFYRHRVYLFWRSVRGRRRKFHEIGTSRVGRECFTFDDGGARRRTKVTAIRHHNNNIIIVAPAVFGIRAVKDTYRFETLTTIMPPFDGALASTRTYARFSLLTLQQYRLNALNRYTARGRALKRVTIYRWDVLTDSTSCVWIL